MGVEKKDLKEKQKLISKMLKVRGKDYDIWLYEKYDEFINDNICEILDLFDKKL